MPLTHKDHLQRFSCSDVQVKTRARVYDGFLKIDKFKLKHKAYAGGFLPEIQRELVSQHDAGGVLIYDEQLDALALIEQFRIGAFAHQEHSPWMLELIAGLIEENELPNEVAIREAQEEAGAEIYDLQLIDEYYVSPGSSSQKFFLYFARADLSQVSGVHGLAEEGEDILVNVIPTKDVFQLLENKQINNAQTLIALLWFKSHYADLS